MTLVDLASPGTTLSITQSASSLVKLFEVGNGVFSIEVAATSDAEPATAMVGSLLNALQVARQEASLKVLLITGKSGLWPGDRAACNQAVADRLFSEVALFPCPVIAAMHGDAAAVASCWPASVPDGRQ